MKRKLKNSLISIFILINLMMMIRAQLPKNNTTINFIYTPISFIQNYLSMWRGWSMFAPDPLKINGFIDAKVIYSDNSHNIWIFPGPNKLSSVSKYLYGERYRKYLFESLRLNSKKYLWDDAAKFVIKKVEKLESDKIIKTIVLRRRWIKIENWDKEFIAHKSTPPPLHLFKTFEFYKYEVK